MEGVCKKAWTSYNYCRKTYKEVARGLKTDHMHVWNWSLICPGRNTGGHLQRATCGRKSVFSTISTRREGSRATLSPSCTVAPFLGTLMPPHHLRQAHLCKASSAQTTAWAPSVCSLIPHSHLDRRVHQAVVDLRGALNPAHCPHARTLLSAHRRGIGIVKKTTNATAARDTTFLICSCSPQR